MKKRSYLKGAPDWTDADYMKYWRSRCTVTETGCWEWQGWCHKTDGRSQLPYAESSYRGKQVRVHRKVLEIKLGRLLDGRLMHACHSCDNPRCINPDHLFEATHTENQRDMVAKGRHCNQVTHCPQGHEYSAENTRFSTDRQGVTRRTCKTCERARMESPEYVAWRREYQRQRRAMKKEKYLPERTSGEPT